MRRQRHQGVIYFVLLLVVLPVVFLLIGSFFSSDYQVEQVVEEFYEYEQEGNFSDSWELLHPFMKEKFPKGPYIQDRAHVFIGHFGAETFQYTLEDAKKLEKWKPSKESKALDVVYRVVVTQSYKGKYGTFAFQQNVYVTKHEGEWVILWDYNW
ncbi:MAG TPA: hypothetical protein VEY51_17660 [Chondromyces sp.]|nr:hypothetical protein [Chondromyces sp.]